MAEGVGESHPDVPGADDDGPVGGRQVVSDRAGVVHRTQQVDPRLVEPLQRRSCGYRAGGDDELVVAEGVGAAVGSRTMTRCASRSATLR